MLFGSPILTLVLFVLSMYAALQVRSRLIGSTPKVEEDTHAKHRQYDNNSPRHGVERNNHQPKVDVMALVELGAVLQKRTDWLVVRPGRKAKMLLVVRKSDGETLYRLTPTAVFNMQNEHVSHSEFLSLLLEAPQSKVIEPAYEDDYYQG